MSRHFSDEKSPLRARNVEIGAHLHGVELGGATATDLGHLQG
jgi:hypothetical protein